MTDAERRNERRAERQWERYLARAAEYGAPRPPQPRFIDLLDAGRFPSCRGDLEADDDGRLACRECGATWGKP